MRAALLALLALAACQDERPARSRAEVRAYQRETICPSTGKFGAPCPGYQVDHIIPLCWGGADDRTQFQYLTIAEHRLKTKADIALCRAKRRK